MIKAFKLVTGEEVVAKISKYDPDTGEYTLDKPRTLMMVPAAEKGQMHLSLIPWMVSAQDAETGVEIDSVLHESQIVGQVVRVPNQLERGYMKNVSTIQLL